MSDLKLPPELARIESEPGVHRGGKKALLYSKWKAGKSEAAASAPNPIFALAIGEPGIIPYLQKDKGDRAFEIYNSKDMYAALNFAFKNVQNFPSIVIDNINLGWTFHMDEEQERLGGEIQKHQWSEVKADWFDFLYKMGRSSQNVVMTSWLGDIVYRRVEQEAKMPGAKAKVQTIPMEADIPKVEKHVPYFPDLIFSFDSKLDDLLHLTETITVTWRGGRVPIGMPTDELYLGKTWTINTKKDPRRVFWDRVMQPIEAAWHEGAVEVVGMDPAEVERGRAEVESVAHDAIVGRVLASFKAATTMVALKKAWDMNGADIAILDKDKAAIVDAAKDARKRELAGR